MRSLLAAVAVVGLVWLSVTGLACGGPESPPAAPAASFMPTAPVPTAVGSAAATVPPMAAPAVTATAVPALAPTVAPTLVAARGARPTMAAVPQGMTEPMMPASVSAGGPAPPGGSGYIPPEAGGSRNPNDAPWPLVYYRGYGVNPFVDADEDPRSTFGLDGDTASYRIGKHYLENGFLPEPDSVRV